jgi:hypothetical protein
MDRDARDPRPVSRSFVRVGIGSDIPYPAPRDRFATVRRNCTHCGLPADTNDQSCPVCGAAYPPLTRRGRLLARLRR